MAGRFRKPKTAKEEQCCIESVVPATTKYATKWGLKIFKEWQKNRRNCDPLKEESSLWSLQDLRSIQVLTTNIEDMTASSLNFWLSKFIQEVAKQDGERYPPKSLYLIICCLNRHLSELNLKDSLNVLDKQDRR